MIASLFTAVVAAVAVAAQGTTGGITVNTPGTPVFCQPTLLSWSGGQAPYFVTINVGGSISQVLENILTSSTATSYTWVADIAPGTAITLAVKDSTGASNFAAQVTVAANPSGVTTCAGASSNVNSASVVNTVSATVSQVSQTTVSQSAAASSAAVVSSASSAVSSAAAGTSSAAGVTRSAASAAASVTGSVASRASGAANSASSAVAAATSAVTGGAAKVGASVVTVGLLAVGSVALFL